LGDRRRASEGRTFSITGAQPLPLLLSQPPFGSGAAACPRVSERDLPLSVERRFSLIEPRLGKAQCVGPGKVRASPRAYDVVILDEALPDHSGGSLARELRALRSNLVLVLTAQENAGRLREDFSTDGCVAIPRGTLHR
jgi:CheY-like chemotaxis protein